MTHHMIHRRPKKTARPARHGQVKITSHRALLSDRKAEEKKGRAPCAAAAGSGGGARAARARCVRAQAARAAQTRASSSWTETKSEMMRWWREEGGKEEDAVCSDGGARAASWMDSVNRPRNTASAIELRPLRSSCVVLMGGIGVLSPPGEEGGKEEGAVCSDGGARAASWMDSVNRPRNTASAIELRPRRELACGPRNGRRWGEIASERNDP